MKFLLRIQYLGTNFCGWQYQPGVRTVQKTLTDAASALFGTPADHGLQPYGQRGSCARFCRSAGSSAGGKCHSG